MKIPRFLLAALLCFGFQTMGFSQSSALHFRNVKDTLKISGSTVLDGTVTIEAVVKFDQAQLAGSDPNQPIHNIYVEDWLGQGAMGQKNFGVTTSGLMGFVAPNYLGAAMTQKLMPISKDEWHHAAFVMDSSTERLYLDGKLVASRPSQNRNIWESTTSCFLGYGWLGYVSSFRISKVARYNGETYTKPGLKLTTDASTLLLYNFASVSGDTIPDESGNGRHGTLGGSTPRATEATSPVLVSIEGSMDSDNDGVNDYREGKDGTDPNNAASFNPLSKGLVAFYPFDGNAKDESGNGNDGQLEGSITASPDQFNNPSSALQFDGSPATIRINQKVLNLGQASYSISSWFKCDDLDVSPQMLFNTEPHTGIGVSFVHPEFPESAFSWRVGRGLVGEWIYTNPGKSIQKDLNKWYQWTLVKSGSDYKFFIDGKLVSEKNVPEAANFDQAVALKFGSMGVQSWYGYETLKGIINQTRIYNRALSAAEVSQLYTKESENPNMVTVQGGTLPSSSQLAGQKVETFQIGKYEVTWGEWKTVRDWAVANGYTDLANVGAGSGDDHPVRNVSWYDVVKWCNAKSQIEGLEPVYDMVTPLPVPLVMGWSGPTEQVEVFKIGIPDSFQELREKNANGYRLPLEKEWEWAAKGGIISQGYNFSGGNELNSVAWNASNTHGSTQPVGTKMPNEFGIYDMSGNIWEWCSDFNSFPYNVKGYDKTIKYRIFKGFSYREQIGDTASGGLGLVDYKPETRPVKFIYIGPSASNGQIATTDMVSVTIYGEIPKAKTDRIGFRLARNFGTAPDTTAPVVSVNSITANARLTSANATFSGSVVETGSKPSLEFRLGTTGYWTAVPVGGSASPYSFSQRVTLKAGPNTVQFRAKDEAGNTSQVLSVPVSFVVSSVLNIAAPNAVDGSISSGFGGNSTREVGVRYTVTATPASGMLFKEWLQNGTRISTNATLSFTMEPGLRLVPVFVPDFAKLGGFYNGPVGTGEMGNGTAADRQLFAARNGFLQIRMGSAGALSGFLRIEGGSHPFSGTMGNNKRATIRVARPGKTNAVLNLNLVSALPGEISGTVGLGGVSVPFKALRGGNPPGVAKHALGGKRYSVVFPPPEGAAMGYGHAMLTVENDGAAVLSGVLANGQAVNAGARLVDDGKGNWVVPVYVGGTGIFTGEIVIPKTAPASGSEIGGSLEWLKPASNTGLFKSGFLKSLQPLGATHSVTSAGLGGAAFSLTLDPAKRILPAAVVQTGTWGNSGSPILTTPIKSGLTLSFNPLSGKFEGSFTRTVNGAPLPTSIQGTLFSRPISIPSGATLRGAGFFTSGNASTAVEITSNATVAAPLANMITVLGGTLPAGSELAGQTVATFQIGKYEVTWGEWKEVRDWAVANGYADLANVGAGSGENHPVRNVCWYDVVKWCNAKSEMEGLEPFYLANGFIYRQGSFGSQLSSVAIVSAPSNVDGYRLPAESEWEWAARGGSSSKRFTYSGSNDLTKVAWFYDNSTGAIIDLVDSSGRGTWPIGQKFANELGLFDMSGNVWEFCWDLFSPKFANRRIRGGAFFYAPIHCSVSYRLLSQLPDDRSQPSIGFRLARNAEN